MPEEREDEWWCFFCQVGGNDSDDCRCCGRGYEHPANVKGRNQYTSIAPREQWQLDILELEKIGIHVDKFINSLSPQDYELVTWMKNTSARIPKAIEMIRKTQERLR